MINLDLDNCDRDADFIYDKGNKVREIYNNLVKRSGVKSNFSPNNKKYLLEYLNKIEDCRSILEIGVSHNRDERFTSTSAIFDTKKDSTIYIGVDIDNKSHLDNETKNIYTIQSDASNIPKVMKFAKTKGVETFDFIFIDGWHSINQCIIEFNGYGAFLSDKGIIGVHDTNYHPGPRWLVERSDTTMWNIAEHRGEEFADFGISFMWKK